MSFQVTQLETKLFDTAEEISKLEQKFQENQQTNQIVENLKKFDAASGELIKLIMKYNGNTRVYKNQELANIALAPQSLKSFYDEIKSYFAKGLLKDKNVKKTANKILYNLDTLMYATKSIMKEVPKSQLFAVLEEFKKNEESGYETYNTVERAVMPYIKKLK